jgi:hypothetical protein
VGRFVAACNPTLINVAKVLARTPLLTIWQRDFCFKERRKDMRFEIQYWDVKGLTTDQINEFDEVIENFFKRGGYTIDYRYFEIATGVRTLLITDMNSRHMSLEYH